MYLSELEYVKDFWPKRDLRAILWHFHIIKSDKSKNVSRYGLYKYIDDEKRVKKNYRKNGMSPLEGIADFCRISTLRPFFGHFHIIKSDKSINFSGYGLYEYIDEEKRVKKNLQKKWHVTIWRNSRFLAKFQLCGHFWDTFTE